MLHNVYNDTRQSHVNHNHPHFMTVFTCYIVLYIVVHGTQCLLGWRDKQRHFQIQLATSIYVEFCTLNPLVKEKKLSD